MKTAMGIMRFITLCIISFLLQGVQGRLRCPSGWRRYTQRCYKVVTSPGITWLEARDACRQRNSYLAAVDSSSEHNFLRSRVLDAWHNNPRQGIVWIGLSVCDHSWVWDGGFTDDFRLWRDGDGAPVTGRCSVLAASTGKWEDVPCGDAQIGYVCMRAALDGAGPFPTLPPEEKQTEGQGFCLADITLTTSLGNPSSAVTDRATYQPTREIITSANPHEESTESAITPEDTATPQGVHSASETVTSDTDGFKTSPTSEAAEDFTSVDVVQLPGLATSIPTKVPDNDIATNALGPSTAKDELDASLKYKTQTYPVVVPEKDRLDHPTKPTKRMWDGQENNVVKTAQLQHGDVGVSSNDPVNIPWLVVGCILVAFVLISIPLAIFLYRRRHLYTYKGIYNVSMETSPCYANKIYDEIHVGDDDNVYAEIVDDSSLGCRPLCN